MALDAGSRRGTGSHSGLGNAAMPETPKWLLKHGRTIEARGVLTRIRGTSDIDSELNQVQATIVAIG
jgi:hypothetical protein